MHKKWRTARAVVAWTLACLLANVAGMAAQTQAELDRDAQEVRAYRLTMPKVRQMADITIAFAKEMAAKPEMIAQKRLDNEILALESKESLTPSEQTQLDALKQKREKIEAAAEAEDIQETKTLAQMAERIEKEPRLSSAIKGGGMTSREYATISLAFYQAMFAYMMQKGGALKELPKEISAENVEFVRQNEATLTQLFSALQAEDRK